MELPPRAPPTHRVVQVHGLLYHPSWEARLAAAATIGGLADAFPHHDPAMLREAAGTAAAGAPNAVELPLSSFDMQRVLSRGAPLLASGGQVRAPQPSS